MIRLVIRMSGPLIPAVRNDQRVAGAFGGACGARAGHLADRAAPLHLQPGQIALPPGSGEDALVDPAQRQVDDQRQVGVVAADPVGECLLGKREGGRKLSARVSAGPALASDSSTGPMSLSS